MSVRVIIKDVKKRTKACDECKRRKGRCDGGMPCEWCSARNLECVFSAFSQKRGPKKKRRENESDNEEDQEILTLDKREQGLSYDMELNTYLDLYMKYIDPLFTMFPQWEKGSKVLQLNHPRSYAQFITKYSACAIAARASGQKERATQLITEARSFAGQCFDDMSMDALVGFMLLAAYWIGMDSKITKHYANIALSIYSTISVAALPANVRYLVTMAAVLVNSAIPDAEKFRAYLTSTNTIVAQTNAQVLLGGIIRLCMKVFAHMKCFEASHLRSDISAVLICQVFFSEKQRQSILSELRYCRTIVKMCPELTSEVVNLVTSTLQALEVFVEWRSGHAELALPVAIELANNCTPENVRFGSRFDVEHLLYISIFLREQQHPVLADKVRKTADALHSVVCETVPELANSADPLASYLRRVPTGALITHNHPAPLASYAQDPYNTMDDTAVPTMVNNVLSLVGQLQPSNNSKSLLSAQGLHLFYNTLSSILPPTPSPFDSYDEPTTDAPLGATPTPNTPTSWVPTDSLQPPFPPTPTLDSDTNTSPPITSDPPMYTSHTPSAPHKNPYLPAYPMNLPSNPAHFTNLDNSANSNNNNSTNTYNNSTINFNNNIIYTNAPENMNSLNTFQNNLSSSQTPQVQKTTFTSALHNINPSLSTFSTLTHPSYAPTMAYQTVPSPITPATPPTPPTPTSITPQTPQSPLIQTTNSHAQTTNTRTQPNSHIHQTHPHTQQTNPHIQPVNPHIQTTNSHIPNANSHIQQTNLHVPTTNFTTTKSSGFAKTTAVYGIPVLAPGTALQFADAGVVPLERVNVGIPEVGDWTWLEDWNRTNP
eukprot:Phypoly_transcript_02308.p1 GENE.Phypoly_transcript_02308~~Phypoly_transcript_02308.p1  ORF type:complete len:829 (+),score=172.72 Phypoly_transcript_02308:163-2649(+)